MSDYLWPTLKWDEEDFLECFVVLPVVEEHGISHTWHLQDNDLTLLLTIWELESVAQFTLSRSVTGQLVTKFAVAIRGGIRYRNDKRGKFMEFLDCIVVPNRFYRLNMGDVLDTKIHPTGLDLILSAHPALSIEFTTSDTDR